MRKLKTLAQEFLLVEIFEYPVAGAMKRGDYRHHFADAQPGLIAFRLAIARQLLTCLFTEPLKLAVEVVNVAKALGQLEVG